MGVLIGVVFLFLGALLAGGRVVPNPIIGIVTRWTLADEEVWYRTNRVAGLALLVWGLLLCIARDRYEHLIYALFAPVLPFVAITILLAMWSFRQRHGGLAVDEAPPAAGAVEGCPPWAAELLPLALIVLGHFGQAQLPGMMMIPTYFDLWGHPSQWGDSSGLVALHVTALVVFCVLTVYGRMMARRFGSGLAWNLFAIKSLAVLLLEAIGLASVLVAREVVTSAWQITGLPALLLLAYVAWFAARRSGGRGGWAALAASRAGTVREPRP